MVVPRFRPTDAIRLPYRRLTARATCGYVALLDDIRARANADRARPGVLIGKARRLG